MAVAIQIDLKRMMTGSKTVEDAAGQKSPTSTLIKKPQFTGFEESVKLKFHPYRKPKYDDGSGLLEMIRVIPSTAMDDVSGEKSPTSILNQFTTEKEELQLPDTEDSVKLKFHPCKKPRSEMITTVPADELEEFFASAEKEVNKRFKNKYNYDIVNDTPLEGRFEWIQLKQ